MATTTIPWDDGSGDNIYLTYPSASGNQTVVVNSDANTGAARTKVVTFSTGNISRQLTVGQDAGVTEHTFTANLSSYDNTDWSYHAMSNIARAYRDLDNTEACAITLKRGAGAETHVYFMFDTSTIPANARIVSVQVKAKVSTTAATANASRGCALCSGKTLKTGSVTLTSTATIRTFDDAVWTRAEVNDIRIKFYATRTSANVNTNYYLRMYGAELTIVYEV